MPSHSSLLTAALLLVTHGLARADELPLLPTDGFADARQPQAFVNGEGQIFVTFGMKHAIYCTVSRDGGKSFTTPVKVGQAGQLALGHRRGPRIAAHQQQVVITAICGEKGGGKDGDVLAWRSSDGGGTWAGPERVNSQPGAAREGLHHLAASADGIFYCVWNDLRKPREMPVYGAMSPEGGTWAYEQVVYASPEGSICPCCQSIAAFDPQGRLHVMWRNSLGGARDMYLITSKDWGKTFGKAQKLGSGEWLTDT